MDDNDPINADWDYSTFPDFYGAASDINRAFADWEKRTGSMNMSWYARVKRKKQQRKKKESNDGNANDTGGHNS